MITKTVKTWEIRKVAIEALNMFRISNCEEVVVSDDFLVVTALTEPSLVSIFLEDNNEFNFVVADDEVIHSFCDDIDEYDDEYDSFQYFLETEENSEKSLCEYSFIFFKSPQNINSIIVYAVSQYGEKLPAQSIYQQTVAWGDPDGISCVILPHLETEFIIRITLEEDCNTLGVYHFTYFLANDCEEVRFRAEN